MERKRQTQVRTGRFSRRSVLRGGAMAGAGAAAALAVGCGDDDEEQPTTPTQDDPTPDPDEVDLDATLRAGIQADVGNTDPQSQAGVTGIPNYTTHFITPLVVDQETIAPVGYAVDFKWIEDNTVLELTAKPGVKFHNGEILDAEQLKFNLDRILGRAGSSEEFRPQGPAYFSNITETVIADPMTVHARFSRPDVFIPPYMAAASGIWLVPKGYIESAGDAQMARDPVGSGPFRFVSRIPDQEIRSTRFDEFFYQRDQPLGPRLPYIKDLVQKVIPETGARIAALEAGEIDIANDVGGDMAKAFEGRAGYKVYYQLDKTPAILTMNTVVETDPIAGGPNPLRDVRVRKALNHAIDVDTMIKTFMTGKEIPSWGVSRASYGFPEDLESKRFTYDPQLAKTLLEQAGYPNGFEVDFHGGSGRFVQMEEVMQVVAGYLSDVGVRTRLQIVPYAQFVAPFASMQLTGLIYSGTATPELALGPIFHSSGRTAYSVDPNLGLDSLIDSARTEFDDGRREALMGRIIQTAYENATHVYLHQPVRAAISRDHVDWPVYEKLGFIAEYWNIRVQRRA